MHACCSERESAMAKRGAFGAAGFLSDGPEQVAMRIKAAMSG
jgi:hypothetical protein